MDITLFLTFLTVSLGIIVVPGPNVLTIVSTSITYGKRRGLQTVAGTTLAMAVQLFVAAVTTSAFTGLLAEGFAILKWVGVGYLIYLGLVHIKNALNPRETLSPISAGATFARGFTVSITNPKTIVFFSAFLPQFISSVESYTHQILLLSVVFLLLAFLLDSCYAILASRVALLLQKSFISRLQSAFGGLLFLGAGAWLAATRRS